MNKDRDLLPWILGGLIMSALPFTIAMSSSGGTAPGNLPTAGQSTAPDTCRRTNPRACARTLARPCRSRSCKAELLLACRPRRRKLRLLRPSQTVKIWQCTINGQKTFSDNPCGAKSSRVELGPVNTMEATPVYPLTRSYEPNYRPEYPYPSSPRL